MRFNVEVRIRSEYWDFVDVDAESDEEALVMATAKCLVDYEKIIDRAEVKSLSVIKLKDEDKEL